MELTRSATSLGSQNRNGSQVSERKRSEPDIDTMNARARTKLHLRVDGSTQSDLAWLASGALPFMHRYSTIVRNEGSLRKARHGQFVLWRTGIEERDFRDRKAKAAKAAATELAGVKVAMAEVPGLSCHDWCGRSRYT
jgi:hypothetical protein